MVRYVLISLFLAKSLLFGQIYATYETKAMKEANLAMTSQGIVNNILVDIGSSVKKSQLLLSLDRSEERRVGKEC